MYAIAGVTGRVGAATARAARARQLPIRPIVRRQEQAADWTAPGMRAAVADLGDPAGLMRALQGCSAAMLMVPFDLTSPDPAAAHARIVASVTSAVASAEVPHVVLLSSVGADLPSGTGPIEALSLMERELRQVTPALTAIRPCHFQEKVGDVLPAVLAGGILPVFAASAQRRFPLVATADVGAAAAELLDSAPTGHREIDVLGPAASESDIAALLAEELDSTVRPVTIPRDGWEQALTDAGFSAPAAAMIAALYAADEDGLLEPRAAQRITGSTPIAETVRALVRRARKQQA